jgi:LPXTG-motif cell wall-anchored protein
MPDTKTIITVVVGVGVLVIIAGSLDALLARPPLLIGLLAIVGGLGYLIVRRRRARNRV